MHAVEQGAHVSPHALGRERVLACGWSIQFAEEDTSSCPTRRWFAAPGTNLASAGPCAAWREGDPICGSKSVTLIRESVRLRDSGREEEGHGASSLDALASKAASVVPAADRRAHRRPPPRCQQRRHDRLVAQSSRAHARENTPYLDEMAGPRCFCHARTACEGRCSLERPCVAAAPVRSKWSRLSSFSGPGPPARGERPRGASRVDFARKRSLSMFATASAAVPS